jgi:hypothetical protein
MRIRPTAAADSAADRPEAVDAEVRAGKTLSRPRMRQRTTCELLNQMCPGFGGVTDVAYHILLFRYNGKKMA